MPVTSDQQLQGKSNFHTWRTEFYRAAKEEDLVEIYDGTAKLITKEPDEDDYQVYLSAPPATHPPNNEKVDAASVPISGELDASRTFLKWQVAYKKWEKDHARIRKATKILNDWVCPAIALEIESFSTPTKAITYLFKQYSSSMERAREQTLEKIMKLKLGASDSMNDYLNKHRILRHEYSQAKGLMTDGQFVTHVLIGLPARYGDFKKQYEWSRAKDNTDNPDLNFLYERLLVEEEDLKKEDQKKADKDKRKKDKTKEKEGRNQEKCTYAECGKWGHNEAECWIAHPELKPDSIKEREKSKGNRSNSEKKNSNRDSSSNAPQNKYFQQKKDLDNKKDKEVVAFASQNFQSFSDALQHAIEVQSGMPPQASNTEQSTDPNDQTPMSESESMGQEESGNGARDGMDLNAKGGAQTACNAGLSHRAIVYLTTGTNLSSSDEIIIDSGCNMYIANDIKWFTSIFYFDYTIETADKSASLQISGGGSAKFKVYNQDGESSTLHLTEVAYAPNARCNLISMSLLATKGGLMGRWDDKSITIEQHDGSQIANAVLIDGFYRLITTTTVVTCEIDQASRNLAALINYDDSVWKWHRRLGHLSWQGMRNLLKISEGMDITDKEIQAKLRERCPQCNITRALNQIPREPARRRAEDVGGLMHVDSWGPYAISGYDGSKRAMMFTDDATRFSWIDLYQEATQAPDIFINLHKRIERSHGIKIRNYRIDHEFQIGDVKKWLDRHHIGIEPTVPYQHHEAGVAERGWRTVREKASVMIADTNPSLQAAKIITEKGIEMLRETSIPESLWPEAMRHSVWLKNRAPTRALKSKSTPFEALHKIKPSLSGERIWGSRAFVTFPPETHRHGKPKLHTPRGWIGYFVGCESESIYHIYSEEKKKVFRVGAARIQDGVGLDDPHDGQSLLDRVPIPEGLSLNVNDSHESESTTDQDVSLPKSLRNPPRDLSPDDDFWHNSDLDGSVEERACHQEDLETEDEGEPENLQNNDSLQDSSDEVRSSHYTTSKYFANLARRRPKNESLTSSEDDSDYSISSEPVIRQGRSKRKRFHISSSCEPCFAARKNCEGGRPCENCKRLRRRCTDQTEYSKKLRFPKHLRLLKGQIQIRKSEKPCRRCYQLRMSCRRPGTDDEPCQRCLREHRKCNNNLQDATVIPSRRLREDTNDKPIVPPEEYCEWCWRTEKRCDGKTPCTPCQIKHKRCIKRSKAGDHIQKCTQCKNSVLFCDKERPCSSCVKNKKTCTYMDQEGLVTRRYAPSSSQRRSGQRSSTPSLDDLESDLECTRCQSKKRNCDGEKPCRNCVKEKGNHPRPCTYRHKDSWKESFSVMPYNLEGPNKEVHLREDWQDHLTLPKRNAPAKGKENKASTTIQTSFQGLINAEASDLYERDFPEGHELILTPSTGFQCGLYAIIRSMAAQHPQLPQPTLSELQDTLRSPAMEQVNSLVNIAEGGTGENHESNFLADHLAAILYHWGRARNLDMVLGYVVEGRGVDLLQSDTTTQDSVIV